MPAAQSGEKDDGPSSLSKRLALDAQALGRGQQRSGTAGETGADGEIGEQRQGKGLWRQTARGRKQRGRQEKEDLGRTSCSWPVAVRPPPPPPASGLSHPRPPGVAWARGAFSSSYLSGKAGRACRAHTAAHRTAEVSPS